MAMNPANELEELQAGKWTSTNDVMNINIIVAFPHPYIELLSPFTNINNRKLKNYTFKTG
jgi:hypothetical protein